MTGEPRLSRVLRGRQLRRGNTMRCSFIVLTTVVLAAATAAAQTAKPAPKPAAPATAAPKPAAPAAPAANRLLSPATLTAKAPEMFKVKFDTTKGPVVILLHRDWAPKGVDRFYNMTRNGFFTGVRFFRVIPNFMAQFGINGNPAVNDAWEKVRL